MENEVAQTPITPEIPMNVETPALENPPIQPAKKSFTLWAKVGIVLGVIVLVAIIWFVVSKNLSDKKDVPIQVVATPTPTPIINSGVSPIATTSAFLQVEQSIASLSARIAGFSPIDSQVVPPVLDLPLGFSK
jgi:hypothetical protein